MAGEARLILSAVELVPAGVGGTGGGGYAAAKRRSDNRRDEVRERKTQQR